LPQRPEALSASMRSVMKLDVGGAGRAGVVEGVESDMGDEGTAVQGPRGPKRIAWPAALTAVPPFGHLVV